MFLVFSVMRTVVRHRFIAGLILGITSLAMGGCGQKKTGPNAKEVVAQAFTGKKEKVRSGRLSVNVSADLDGLPSVRGPVGLLVEGPFMGGDDQQLPKFDLDFTVRTPSGSLTAGAILTKDRGFLKLQGSPYFLSDKLLNGFRQSYLQARKKSQAANTKTPSLAVLGFHPETWLKNARFDGEDTLDGTKVQRVKADLDPKKMLTDIDMLLQSIRKLGLTQQSQITSIGLDQQTTIAKAISHAQLQLAVGKEDHQLRKFVAVVEFAVPETSRPDLGGLQSGKLTLQLGFSQLNRPQEIVAPPDAQPLSRLTAAIRQLQGNGAIGNLASKLGSGSKATQPGQNESYETCVRAAGEDLTKLQKCASLLNR